MKTLIRKNLISRCSKFFALFLISSSLSGFAQPSADAAINLEIQATEMEAVALSLEEANEQSLTWAHRLRPEPISRHGSLAVGSIRGAEQQYAPAKSNVTIPSVGTYYVWVRYAVHPMRSKAFTVAIQGNVLPFASKPYGASQNEELGLNEEDPNVDWEQLQEWKQERSEIYGEEPFENNMIWTRREVTLAEGPCPIVLTVTPRNELPRGVISHEPEVDTIIITGSPQYHP